MTCPDCGSEESIKDQGQLFCKKCGLELEELIIPTGRGKASDSFKTPNMRFFIDPDREYETLKLGLLHNKLIDDWQKKVGFTVSTGKIEATMKLQAKQLLRRAFEKHHDELEASKKIIKAQWLDIASKYFFGLEQAFDIHFSEGYTCYLSLVAKFGFHNSSRNSVTIQHTLHHISNYIIADQVFQIVFRNWYLSNYTTFDDQAKILSKLFSGFVLLVDMKALFKFEFTPGMITPDQKDLYEFIKQRWDKQTIKQIVDAV